MNIDKDSVMTMLQFLDGISKSFAIRWWKIIVEKYEWFSTVNWLCFRIIFMLHVTAVIKKNLFQHSFNCNSISAFLSRFLFLRLCFYNDLRCLCIAFQLYSYALNSSPVTSSKIRGSKSMLIIFRNSQRETVLTKNYFPLYRKTLHQINTTPCPSGSKWIIQQIVAVYISGSNASSTLLYKWKINSFDFALCFC